MRVTDKNNQQNSAEDEQDNSIRAGNTAEAMKQAEKDISKDPDLSNEPDPADDLDEGELARLEGEE